MEYSLTVARHLAQLVWLLLNEEGAHEAQIATLRSLVTAAKEGAVTLATRDWRLIVNGEPVPDGFPGGEDLAAQLAGHCVAELHVAHSASPVDLLCCARVLATDPLPGDRGGAVQVRLRAIDARTVRVRLDAPEPPAATPATRTIAIPPASPTPVSVPTIAAPAAPMPGFYSGMSVPMPSVDVPGSAEVARAMADAGTPRGSMEILFAQLDAATTATDVGNQLSALVKLALESARRERLDVVADVFAGIVEREARSPDGPLQRTLGISIRRLSVPSVLNCVAALLPQREEHYDRYMAVLKRAEDVGAEALVDALVSAPSIGYRRLYFDALVQLGAGMRALLHMLGDSRWYVVRNAAELLGEMGVTEAVPELTKLLDHADDRVRAAAGGALARLSTGTAARGVRTALRDTSAEVREHAVDVVAGRGSERSERSLIRAIDQAGDDGAQMAMLTALARLGTPAAIEKLVSIASSEGSLFKRTPIPLRVAAVHALGKVDSPRAMDALQALLRDEQKDVRGAASWVVMGKKRRAEGPPQ